MITQTYLICRYTAMNVLPSNDNLFTKTNYYSKYFKDRFKHIRTYIYLVIYEFLLACIKYHYNRYETLTLLALYPCLQLFFLMKYFYLYQVYIWYLTLLENVSDTDKLM